MNMTNKQKLKSTTKTWNAIQETKLPLLSKAVAMKNLTQTFIEIKRQKK